MLPSIQQHQFFIWRWCKWWPSKLSRLRYSRWRQWRRICQETAETLSKLSATSFQLRINFEDGEEAANQVIFFTRIVRIAECLGQRTRKEKERLTKEGCCDWKNNWSLIEKIDLQKWDRCPYHSYWLGIFFFLIEPSLFVVDWVI